MTELRKNLENIRAELEALCNAEYTDEEREEMENNGEAYDLYSYFNDVLDYEYTISRSREYLGAKIWVTLGGPNIWIDTRAEQICGAWGNEREAVCISKDIASEIDAIFEDMYNIGNP